MPIQIYQSRVPGTLPGRSSGPATQGAPLSAESTADFALTKVAAEAAGKVSGALVEKANKDQEVRNAADLLDEENRYFDDTMRFEQEWKDNHIGMDAADNTEAAYQAFHDKRGKQSADRFVGNPKMSYMWSRQNSQMRMSSTGRGRGYADQQDKVYRADVTQSTVDTYLQRVAAVAGDSKAVENARIQANGKIYAVVPSKEAREIIMAELDKKTAITRIGVMTTSKNFPEAKKLLGEYKGVLGESYDNMIAQVEGARVVDQKAQGGAFAQDLITDGVPADDAWKQITKIKDEDKRAAARSAYSSHWVMQNNIDTQTFQNGTIAGQDVVNSMAATDLPGAEAYWQSLPEGSEVERRIKKSVEARLNEWKRSKGIEPLTDSESYIGIWDDIMGGRLTTREEVLSDERAATITKNDLYNDLVGGLKDAQKTTDKAINDAGRLSFEASVWNAMSTNRKFDIVQRVKNMVKETNRGQETDYIQKVMDTMALEGIETDFLGGILKVLPDMVYSGGALVNKLQSGEFTMAELDKSITEGEAKWLPSSTPKEFDNVWGNPKEFDQKVWKKMYGEDAKKAAYVKYTLMEMSTLDQLRGVR